MVKHAEKIEALIEPTVTQLGFELVGCEHASVDGKPVLRVYIDHPNGLNVDDCAKVSRRVSAVLDVEDVMSGRYNLEVSSPGVDRPLFTLAHFAKVQGQTVYVKLHVPSAGRRQLTGKLESVALENVRLVTSEGVVEIPFSNVEKAHVCAELNFK